MNWQNVAAQLAQLGLPVLGRIVGGELLTKIPILGSMIDGRAAGEAVGRQVAVAIGLALGVPADQITPEAVSAAIESQPTTSVVATLQSVEAEAAARWPAVMEAYKADATVETEAAKLNAEAFLARTRAEAATNGWWSTQYKTVALWGCSFALIYIIGLQLAGATLGGTLRENLVAMETMVWGLQALLAGVVLGHWITRASERKALLAPPPAAASVAPAGSTTTVVMQPAPVIRK